MALFHHELLVLRGLPKATKAKGVISCGSDSSGRLLAKTTACIRALLIELVGSRFGLLIGREVMADRRRGCHCLGLLGDPR